MATWECEPPLTLEELSMRKTLLTALSVLALASAAPAACCYFAALEKDVNQPGQRAFITWDEAEKRESFTVQPMFEGNAPDFGMVIPTPSRPKLQEMPRDFFKELAVFTILEPMDMSKFKSMARPSSYAEGARRDKSAARPAVRVLEAGVVGSLDYKILEADRADALYEWLKQNKYSYAGDTETLAYYVQKKWTFTVMKIDPRQMKKRPDGSFLGEITPTRFTFATSRLIYPLHITQISVKDTTDALFYVMAREKMDLPGQWSYEGNFMALWGQAMSFAVPEKLTAQEKEWMARLSKKPPTPNPKGAQLEWSGRLTQKRLDVLTGKAPYNRDAPPEEVKKLTILRGHLKEGYYLTKFRKQFHRSEMTQDIQFVSASYQGARDDLEYVQILPTSPP